jgi:hypothetical protein
MRDLAGANPLYGGTFRFELANVDKPDRSYALMLDGKVTDDPWTVAISDGQGFI